MTEVLATYTLQVKGPANPDGSLPSIRLRPVFIREAEENMSDLLPKDYYVEIREWDEAQNGESHA